MRILLHIIKYLMIIALILAIASYLNYLRTGEFWIPTTSLTSVKSSLPSLKPKPVMQTLEAPKEAVYKWRVNGEWVYGDTPPPGVNAQRVGAEN